LNKQLIEEAKQREAERNAPPKTFQKKVADYLNVEENQKKLVCFLWVCFATIWVFYSLLVMELLALFLFTFLPPFLYLFRREIVVVVCHMIDTTPRDWFNVAKAFLTKREESKPHWKKTKKEFYTLLAKIQEQEKKLM